MTSRFVILLFMGIASAISAAAAVEADARSGSEFFAKQGCAGCHAVGQSVKAERPGIAPDLARRLDRDYTPSALASRMWDHAPTMWAQMRTAGITPPRINEQQAADLFAFFYAARYFDRPGDAARGRRVFEQKHCADCHALSAGSPSVGPPVAAWQALRDPIALVQQMWGHAGRMKEELAKRKLAWPEMTSQNLDDLMVYLQNLPQNRRANLEFTMPSSEGGEALFREKGCVDCHHGDRMALENRLNDQTLTGVAADMWNHAPRMKQGATPISYNEMRQIVGYVWGRQFFGAHGNPEHGRRVFEKKHCGTCHDQGDAPSLGGNPQFSTISMVAALWQHGPRMLDQMHQKGVNWPQLTPLEMSDTIAYLASRDKASDRK